jgi:thermitase
VSGINVILGGSVGILKKVKLLRRLSAMTLTFLLMGALILGFSIHLVRSEAGRAEGSGESSAIRESGAEAVAGVRLEDGSAELVVGIRENRFADAESLVAGFGSRVVDTVMVGGKVTAVVSDVPSEAVAEFVKEAGSEDFVRYVEPRVRFDADLVPNDPYESLQWGLEKIDAQSAWNVTTGDSDVVVAVVDTGVDYEHPDLDGNYVALGYDWVNYDADPMDDNGHGSHCAGIIAAELDNGVGVAGVAQVRIIAEKGLGEYGWGWSDDLASAISHAVDQGAGIISCSWGSGESSELIHDAVRYAYESGVLVVASAGNNGWQLKNYPACYEEVVAVAATDRDDKPSSFSNYGDWVEVSAPGSYIFSTMPNSAYVYLSGTSMSAPCVAGVAALVWSRFPDMTVDQVRQQLLKTSDDLGDPGFDVRYGYGRVNASRAVEQAWPRSDVLILGWQKSVIIYSRPAVQLMVNATVFNFGADDQGQATVQMIVDGAVVDSEQIGSLASGGSVAVQFPWVHQSEGSYNVTVYVVPLAGEAVTDNNVMSFTVRVRAPRVVEVKLSQSIQAAINSAYPGDTLEVDAGIFHENLVLNKSVSLIGGRGGATVIDGNGAGTIVHVVADDVTVSNFTIRNGDRGICLECSYRSVIVGNSVLNCSEGIVLLYSGENTLVGNSMSGNGRNLGVDGDFIDYVPSQFMQDVDVSNTVDGKPIYYWVNERDRQVPADAGFVAVVSSTNITVKNLELRGNAEGVLFAYTNNSVIEAVNASQNKWGVLMVGSFDNTVQGNTLTDNDCGVQLQESFSNSVNENVVANNNDGIKLAYSDDNFVGGNTVSSNAYQGVSLEYSFRNSVGSNNVLDNREGISLAWSPQCVLDGNTLAGNDYNLGVDGDHLSDFVLDVDTSNMVNGRSVFYLVNQHRLEINSSTFPDAGYLALVNCTEIIVRGLSLAANSNGVLLAYTSNSTIEKVDVSNCWHGVDLVSCERINIFENTITSSDEIGLSLRSSDDNKVVGNTIVSSAICAVTLSGSRNNEIVNNELSGNRYGGGFSLEYSSAYNSLKANLVKGNLVGVFVDVNEPHSNRIYYNNFVSNTNQVLALSTFWFELNDWDDGMGQGNYWSSYAGEDLNADGIGDTLLPYLGVDKYPLMTKYWNPSDVNHDGKIDILDVSRVARSFQCRPGDERWNPAVDFDGNGVINIVDISIVAKAYGKTS